MNTFLLATLLGLWSGIAMVFNLMGLGLRTALINGIMAGVLVGDVALGFEIGATTTLMGIGFYTYGGATIPDYVTGAIFGVVAGQRTGDSAIGLTVAITLSLLMTQMDILGRATTTIFQHAADKALEKNSIGSFEAWTLAGSIPWILSRAVPVFIGILLADNLTVLADFSANFKWFTDGLAVVGRSLPAVGFALLLSYMDIKKYWPFMIIGYVLFAYMNVPTIGLALVGAAAGFLYTTKKGGAQ
ncbi:MAG: PTS sugar transporter subunit IIC [Erysipelotrichaceae bacterium]|nr:PTS sugar transporter subunit IIC [Erysipelotrichaceae bacterium]MDD3924652.1 PTS sugar transporter subunit IIC [Erysipelotrichaceae bacterium]MDD4643260.1 PTS sugar transporter subunit IIC [Erysipelotrichaceae bacterium]